MVKVSEKILEKSIRILPTMNVSQVYSKRQPVVPKAKTDIEIIVHGMELGMGVLGHVDICIDGYVYSYGNYDELTSKMSGIVAEGVLLKAPRNEYFEFCKRHYQKTLFIYSLKFSQEQKEMLRKRLNTLLQATEEWVPTNEICSFNPVSEQLEEMYAYFMVQAMPVTFYKFRQNRFEVYTLWRHNCLQFVDWLMAGLNIPRLRARVTTFPSLYQERLEALRRNSSSVVIDCEIY